MGIVTVPSINEDGTGLVLARAAVGDANGMQDLVTVCVVDTDNDDVMHALPVNSQDLLHAVLKTYPHLTVRENWYLIEAPSGPASIGFVTRDIDKAAIIRGLAVVDGYTFWSGFMSEEAVRDFAAQKGLIIEEDDDEEEGEEESVEAAGG